MARTITYTIKHADGTAWVNATPIFQFSPDSYTATLTFPSDTITGGATDSDGLGSVELWQNATGVESTSYLVTLPSGETFEVSVPAGTTTLDLSDLRGGTIPSAIAGDFFLLSTYGTLAAAIAAIGATEGTLLMDIPDTLTANATVPTTLGLLWSSPGNELTTSTFTLTINGPLEAGLFQIFISTGGSTVTSRIDRAYPQWWGAVGDGTNDDTAAIQAAIDSVFAVFAGAVRTSPEVFLTPGTFLISDSLITPGTTGRIKLVGTHMFESRLVAGSGFAVPFLVLGLAATGSNNIELADFGIVGTNQTSSAPGIKMLRQDRARITRVESSSCSGAGLLMSNCTVTINECQFSGNGGDGILARSCTATFINRCLNNGNGGYSVNVETDDSDITGTPPIGGGGATQVTISHCSSESSTSGEIRVDGSDNVMIDRCQLQAKDGSAIPVIDLSGDTKNCTIIGNYFRMQAADPVTTAGGSSVEAPAIRFGTATKDNVYGWNTNHAGNGIRVRIQDNGLNYSVDPDRFAVKASMNADGGAPLAGWAVKDRTNTALHSEDLTDAVWVASGGAAIAQSGDAGNPHVTGGTSTRIVAASGTSTISLTQTVTVSVSAGDRVDFGLFFVFPGWTTARAGIDFSLKILDSGDTLLTEKYWKPTADWERYILSYISAGSHSSLKIQFHKVSKTNFTYHAWGASLYSGALGVAPYLTTGAATASVTPGSVAARVNATKALNIGLGTDILQHLSATVAWDPGSLANGANETKAITVTGAAVGDTVAVGLTTITAAGWQISGFVTSANTVTVSLTNHTGGTLDLASGTLRADVWKH